MAEDSYIFPLSFAQQRLWLLDRIAPGNPFYNIPLAIPIAAYLDLRALEKALNAIVARHESLRTTFRVVDNEPVQLVHPKLELTISITDLSSLSAAELRTREVELATEEARKPFDLEQGPLIRCGVIVRGWTDYILLITMHHIVSDGWSMGIFMQELTVFYQSFCINYPIKLPDLPVQYPDFAVWQRDWLKGEVLETQLGYWREHLRDLPVLELPTDHPRPLYSSYKGSSYPVRVGYALSHQVRKFASSHGVTPFMVLLSVFAAVLQRYSGHEEIVIGIPVANRTRTELEGLIGFFVNSLVLRIDLKGDPSFSEIVDRVREVSLAAYAHQDLPFEKLVEELHPSRDPSRNPLFQVTFQLVNTPSVQDISSSENSTTTIHVQRGSAIFDLAFSLLDGATEFSGIFEYSTDLFDQTTIARIERHFRQLLHSAVANPNDSFASLPMLSRAEEDELLEQSRGPELELPAQPFVHRLIAEQASRTPDAVAVRSGASELRYRELIQQSTQLANYLRGRGVETEQCVGILMDRSIDLVVALLGVLEAGAVYLPLDPAYPVERLRYMLADSGAKVILTQSGQPLIPELASEKVDVVVMDHAGWRADSDAQPSLPVELSPNNLCYVLYTSGSTGRPKGVGVPHSALTNHMQWMADRFPLTETDRVLQRTPYSFDASIWEFFAPLMAGATLIMLPPEAQKDPSLIVQCLANGVTVAQFVPSLLRVVLDEPAFYTCAALRQIFCGGEAFDDELRERLRTSVDAEVINLYGPTEATVDSAFYVTSDRSEPFGVPIGGPISNTHVYLLDENLKPVPLGIAGEVYISGAALARGYLNQPAATADRFLPDPYSTQPGARMYRTGDRGRRLSDGAVLFLGRIDDLVKVRGFRVELGEIEENIRRVEGVNDCAVVVEDSESELARLVGFVVPSWDQSTAMAIEHEQLSQWEELYHDIYAAAVADDSAAFVGWNSSYTGLPIDRGEMSEWRASTVDRIRKLEPSRVLEIGCGTGLLLVELAPSCERYVGTDFSLPAVRIVEACVARLNGARELVQLLHRSADDFTDFAPGMFDTVILNSVVQYFPSVDYLVRVIENAVRVVAPGGSIFIGDVRNLQLLEAFQLSVALHKLGPNADPAELWSHVQTAIEQEEELVIDPAFFYVLAANVPGVAGAEISLKRGRNSNELTRFRYDVVLRVGDVSRISCPGTCIDWQQQRLSLPQLVETVRNEQPDHLIVRNITNARVINEVRLADKLSGNSEQEIETAIHPQDFWQAPELQDYDLRVTYSHPRGRECFDLVLSKRGTTPLTDPAEAESARQAPVWDRYANKPVRAAVVRRLTASIRAQISNQLPEYMVPSALIPVEQLPLLPNGKLNRNALRTLGGRQKHRRVDTPPRNSIEHALSIIWQEVLNTDHVDMRDDFFSDLGGHSLLAMQLISRIREAFQIDVPLKLVFQSPTIEQFASAFLELVPEEQQNIDHTASLFVRLSQMSETEIDAALARAAV